jgi:electron transport complex protein RnfB
MGYTISDKCIGCRLCVRVCPTRAIAGLVNKPHKIEAARCIDCGACGRVCPKAAVFDPAGKLCQRVRLRKRWPKPAIDLQRCINCRACIDACPVSCLRQTAPGGSRDAVRVPELFPPRDCIACP